MSDDKQDKPGHAQGPGLREALELCEDVLAKAKEAYNVPDSPIINLALEQARAALAHPVAVEQPTSPAVDGEMREAVARIIDGDAFVQPTHPAPDDRMWRGQRKNFALTKADEILALTSRVSAPVAYRWRHVNDESHTWHYQSGMVNSHNEYIEVQPLYASPSPALDPATVEACARELEQRYPDHKWVNAYCAAIRALAGSLSSTVPTSKKSTANILRQTSFDDVSCEKSDSCAWPECDCRRIGPHGGFACPICGESTPHNHSTHVEKREECSGCMNPACEDCFDPPSRVSQTDTAWRTIETAPHEERVLLGWIYQGAWFCETGMASHGWRRGAYSNMSRHGQATHWMPLPAAPVSLQDRVGEKQ